MTGRTVAQGRYEILEKLGEGGAAFVYRAYDHSLAREVAIKVLRPELASDAEFVERFRREAHAAAALSHPHIASVFDIGTEDGNHFFVMEYLPGGTLKDRLEEKGRIPPTEALAVASAVCSALQSAHDHGIVHRDIKPRNIMFTRDGHVKVADFGIARALAAASISQTGTIIGSVHYISPEQAAGEDVGPQSDVYSLGVVLFEMLTGKVPFNADTPVAVALRHIYEPTPSLRLVHPALASTFDHVIGRALAKQPADRYPSAQAMREDVEKLRQAITQAGPMPVAARAADDATRVIQRPSTSSPYLSTGSAVVRRREFRQPMVEEEPTFSPATWAIVIIAVVVALAGIAYLVYRNNAPTAVPPENPPPPQTFRVPSLVGRTLGDARRLLAESGLDNFRIEDEETDLYDPGTVTRQSFPPGSTISATDILVLTVAKAKAPEQAEIAVPDVQGLRVEAAAAILIEQGFDHTIIEDTDETVEKGRVIRQSPLSGTMAHQGDKVMLVVSLGPPEPPATPGPERPVPPLTPPEKGPTPPPGPEEVPPPPPPETEGPDAGSRLAPEGSTKTTPAGQ